MGRKLLLQIRQIWVFYSSTFKSLIMNYHCSFLFTNNLLKCSFVGDFYLISIWFLIPVANFILFALFVTFTVWIAIVPLINNWYCWSSATLHCSISTFVVLLYWMKSNSGLAWQIYIQKQLLFLPFGCQKS